MLFGARTTFVTIARLITEMARQPGIRPILVHRGPYYRETMSDQLFSELHIRQPDFDLGIGWGSRATRIAFHRWGHVRRFTNPRLDVLLEGFAATSTRYVGKREPYHLGFAICPHCSNTAFRMTHPEPRHLTDSSRVPTKLGSETVQSSRFDWDMNYGRRSSWLL